MAKPPKIKNKTEVFIGVFGFLGIVFNLWRAMFTVDRPPFELFAYLLLTVFSTSFFSWLIYSNFRKRKDYDKPKDKKY